MERHTQPFSIRAVRDAVTQFFHAQHVPYGLAAVRIVLPLVLLIPLVHRWKFVRELYSADGAPSQLSVGFGYGNMLPELPGEFAVGLFSLMVLMLLSSSLGWFTRLSLIIGTTLFTYFSLLDSSSTMTKYSVIAIDALLVLCVSPCGAVWSIDAWLRSKRASWHWPGEASVVRPRFPVWPARLIQLLIGFVYFGAAITKMQTSAFFSGDQMRYWMLSNVNFENPLGEYLAMYPSTLVFCAYITIVWEVLFLFLVWSGWKRIVMLAIGVAFHVMTCLTLGLYIFPAVCFSIYLSFLTESDVQIVSAWGRRLLRRMEFVPAAGRRLSFLFHGARRKMFAGLQPAWTFGTLVVLCVLGGIEIEYQLDRYGLRRPEGRYTLEEIDPALAQQMIASRELLREQDKIFSFRTGTVMIGGTLANDREQFHYNDTLIAQCLLNPPHEDMWVECSLQDSAGRLIDRNGYPVTRDMLRCHFNYTLGDALQPGHYDVVLSSAGEEVARRTIRLVGTGASAPLAN